MTLPRRICRTALWKRLLHKVIKIATESSGAYFIADKTRKAAFY